MNITLPVCTHIDQLAKDWEGFLYPSEFCGETDPHIHNDDSPCQGIMCDYGCNAEDF